MLGRSWLLVGLVLLIMVSLSTYNLCGILVSEYLTSVHRLFAQQSCTALVWVVSLAVHYLWGTKCALGEAWTSYSFLQLLGFAMLAFGQLVYSEFVILRAFDY